MWKRRNLRYLFIKYLDGDVKQVIGYKSLKFKSEVKIEDINLGVISVVGF